MTIQVSADADEPTQCTASWQTAKFKNGHVTITTPIYEVICHHFGIRLDTATGVRNLMILASVIP